LEAARTTALQWLHDIHAKAADLKGKRVMELKELCRAHNIRNAGSKDDIVGRLVCHLVPTPPPPVPYSRAASAFPDEPLPHLPSTDITNEFLVKPITTTPADVAPCTRQHTIWIAGALRNLLKSSEPELFGYLLAKQVAIRKDHHVCLLYGLWMPVQTAIATHADGRYDTNNLQNFPTRCDDVQVVGWARRSNSHHPAPTALDVQLNCNLQRDIGEPFLLILGADDCYKLWVGSSDAFALVPDVLEEHRG
jgi:hypothetical protein